MLKSKKVITLGLAAAEVKFGQLANITGVGSADQSLARLINYL